MTKKGHTLAKHDERKAPCLLIKHEQVCIPHLWHVPPTCAYFTYHKAGDKYYMNLNVLISQGIGGGGFLHLLLKNVVKIDFYSLFLPLMLMDVNWY